MDRLLIVPAAGLGSRLGGSVPKLLVPVNGRPMIERVLDMYSAADRTALIVHPLAAESARARLGDRVDIFVQHEPTGMLDAILLARPAVEADRPRRIVITWCDQVAIHPRTIERLFAATAAPADPAVALATCAQPDPYIHFERDAGGTIVRVLQKREGDNMPAVGESDAGLFDLSRSAFVNLLPEYAADAGVGMGTGERNFLPFVPWAAARGEVTTVSCLEREESIGVNTPAELERIERYLRERGDAQRTR
jgi:bifunctional N-acetylglucosamine-1-phosphate-uridyltransferase/glucosamine-1-phosphate-acetyltransferase GlmU-like protein